MRPSQAGAGQNALMRKNSSHDFTYVPIKSTTQAKQAASSFRPLTKAALAPQILDSNTRQ